MPIIAFLLIMFNVDVTVSIGIAGIIGLMTIFLFPVYDGINGRRRTALVR